MHPFDRIADSLTYIAENHEAQPGLAELAQRAHLSEFHFQRVFREWAGISPKQFLQHITIEHARACLDQTASVMEASLSSGLSGASRLHDLFIKVDALSPGEYKSGGAGLLVQVSHCQSPLGPLVVMMTERGMSGLEFLADETAEVVLARMQQRLPNAQYVDSDKAGSKYSQSLVDAVFGQLLFGEEGPDTMPRLSVLLAGTPFQIQVWRALLRVPPGALASYSQIAGWVGKPAAHRAVGTAVGANAIGVLIPCHRVIRANGGLGDYRWGLPRKLALQALERTASS